MQGNKDAATRPKPTPDQKDRLQFFAGQQRVHDGAGQHCPRCGRPFIKPVLDSNAVCRYFRIYICDGCGSQEGYREGFQSPLPFKEWACMRSPNFSVVLKNDTEVDI